MSNPITPEVLKKLALDLRWSWSSAADELWNKLDADLWAATDNPCVLLQTVAEDRLAEFLRDARVQELVAHLLEAQRELAESARWFQQTHDSEVTRIAYFSMEFMLSEALPIYSGGLGNVAGDQLKAASDLGVPVVGVGLLYQQGYFRQEIDRDGNQHALYPFNDPGQLPITPVRDGSGGWMRVRLELPGFDLWVRAWQAQVGRTKLYLLDTNDPSNAPALRSIAAELYGGGPEMRIRQELVLGIGGWRLLRALGEHPEVCHLNEGHAAFAILERARSWTMDHKQPFWQAMEVTRAGNLFTTHTPVEAGFDRFSPELMWKYLGDYAENKLGIAFDEMMRLGRVNGGDHAEPFNMAYLATRGSGSVNGVSRLHGAVSRKIFQPLFERWPREEVPVSYVTNGVHMPSWDSERSFRLWSEACGRDPWTGDLEGVTESFRQVADEKVWQFRNESRGRLVEYIRARLGRDLAARGASSEWTELARRIFDPNVLTLGFARRFATYKRPNLLLHDADRLLRILTNAEHPVQLIIAGKAHPADGGGQAMIRQWIDFIRRPEARPHVVFLVDYDMLVTEHMVEGVDGWLNTPRRPWEACGTSGMKVLVNGGLNVSELDGWWAEAYAPEVGWALGDGKEHDDDPAWDAAEADRLYWLLENEIVPQFYSRDGRGIPVEWVRKIRESMARLTPAFSANRAVRQYTEQHYLPLAKAFRERSADEGRVGAELLDWSRQLDEHWPGLRFGDVRSQRQGGKIRFETDVYFGSLNPDAVLIELFANNGEQPFRQAMQRGQAASGGWVYSAEIATERPEGDFTVRAIPNHANAFVPLESNHITWQR